MKKGFVILSLVILSACSQPQGDTQSNKAPMKSSGNCDGSCCSRCPNRCG